jgi:hypothetical protein
MKSWLKQCAQDRIPRFGSLAMFLKCRVQSAVSPLSFSKTTPDDAAQAVVTICRISGSTRGVQAGVSTQGSVLDWIQSWLKKNTKIKELAGIMRATAKTEK